MLFRDTYRDLGLIHVVLLQCKISPRLWSVCQLPAPAAAIRIMLGEVRLLSSDVSAPGEWESEGIVVVVVVLGEVVDEIGACSMQLGLGAR